jgi:hypothetical protein
LAVEFVAVLEQSEDRHPLVNLAKKRKIESLLAGPASSRLEGATFSAPTKRYNKVVKLDPESNRRLIEVAHGEKKEWGPKGSSLTRTMRSQI